MLDKFEIYDVMGVLVPGVIVVGAIPLAFPDIAATASATHFPEAFGVIVLIAAAIFAGHFLQAIASLLEPVLNWTWGGRASELALTKGLGERYLPFDMAMSIRAKLVTATSSEASIRSLFLFAMGLAESSQSSRAGKFNALYAYHRALLVLDVILILMFFASLLGGFAASLTHTQVIIILAILVVLLFILWRRTRERGFYYVREVLLCAGRQLPMSAE